MAWPKRVFGSGRQRVPRGDADVAAHGDADVAVIHGTSLGLGGGKTEGIGEGEDELIRREGALRVGVFIVGIGRRPYRAGSRERRLAGVNYCWDWDWLPERLPPEGPPALRGSTLR